MVDDGASDVLPCSPAVCRVVIGFCRDLWRMGTVRRDYFYPHYLPDKTVEKAYAHPPPKMTKDQWKWCCDWFATPEFQPPQFRQQAPQEGEGSGSGADGTHQDGDDHQ